MSQINNDGASQPAAQATKSDGKQNVSVDSLAAMLMRGEQPAKEEPKEVATQTPPQEEKIETTEQQSASTEAVETEQPEVETEEEAHEEVLSQDKGLSPELQDKVNKRIGKEVAKRKALEESLEALKAEIETIKASQSEEVNALQTAPIYASPTDPLAHINDAVGLQNEYREAKEIMRIAEDALDTEGVENGYEFQGQRYTKQQLKTIMREARRTIEDRIPQRAQVLQKRDSYIKAAEETFSWAKDKTSKEYKQAVALMKQDPRLATSVDGLYAAGIYLKGLHAIEAEKAAASKPKPAPRAPASQVAAPSSSAKARTSSDDAEAKARNNDAENFKASKRNLSGRNLETFLLKKSG